MKCCVQNCGNSDAVKKINWNTKRITYHLFPKDPVLRGRWLDSLAIPNLVLGNKSAICSEHFKADDFCVNKQGARRLKNGVVPFIEDNGYGSAASRVCKVCLALDNKMYQIKDHSLDKLYEDVLGITPSVDPQNRLPTGICWECTARLQSASAFRSKALFSDALLQDHLKTNADLKIIDIKNLLENHTYLKSSISIQEVFKLNSHNIDDYAPNTFMKTEVLGVPDDDEIEDENPDITRAKNTLKENRKKDLEVKNLPKTNLKTKLNTDNDSGEDSDGISDDDEVKTVIKHVPVNKKRKVVENKRKKDLKVKNLPKTNLKTKLKTDNHSGEDSDDDKVITVTRNVPAKQEAVENDLGNEKDTRYVRTKDSKNDDFKRNLISEEDDDEDLDSDDNVDDESSNASDDGDDDENSNDTESEDVNGAVKKRMRKVRKHVDGKKMQKQRIWPPPAKPVDANIFTVKPLNHDDLRREILARRQSDKYLYAPFKCEVCYVGFRTLDRKERHVVKHNEVSGPYECDICHIRSRSERLFREHMRRQHTMEYCCKLCPMVTRLRGVALGHVKYHSGSKYKCTQCPAEFEKATTLQSHLRLKHMSAYVCELCGYTFLSEKGIHIHKRLAHKLLDKNTKLKGPHCDVCEMRFLNDKAYKLHLRLSSKHIAEDDPKRMNNDSSLKPRRFTWAAVDKPVMRPVIHLKTEDTPVNTGPVTCEQCGLVLNSLQEYASHFQFTHPGVTRIRSTHASTPYMCELCAKLFPNSTTLACHMWVHTGQKLFQCDHCKKSFSMKGKLAHHIRHEHEGPRKTYGCPECGKHYTFNYNLTRHMMLHTGIKPFSCEHCEKTFSTLGELRQHVNYVHLKMPRPKRVIKRKIVTATVNSQSDDDDN